VAIQIKVAAKSHPTEVAGSIAKTIREHQRAEVRAIGAGAVNQAVKAIIIARHFLEPDGVDLICVPAFETIHIGGIERTVIRLSLESRPLIPTAGEHPGSG
jgi:stage V sporulation protein S